MVVGRSESGASGAAPGRRGGVGEEGGSADGGRPQRLCVRGLRWGLEVRDGGGERVFY